jgi:1-acyl-sn-glycerol-3-phosphate acyltransferase
MELILESLKLVQKWLVTNFAPALNSPIAMFPEGTRSDGTYIGEFKAGAKMVGNKFNLKVQPVVMFNTRNIVNSQKMEAAPGVVKVIYLEPIVASKDTSWYEDCEKNMKEVFEKEYKNYVS